MIGFFKSLFGKKVDQQNASSNFNDQLSEVYNPTNEHDRVGLALLVGLQSQLGLLNYKIGELPPHAPFTSDKCRGALYGLACGILISEHVELTKETLEDTLIAAFVTVYGDEHGPALAIQTAQDVKDEVPDVLQAGDWAIEDVKGVYASGGNTSMAAFYLAATGMI